MKMRRRSFVQSAALLAVGACFKPARASATAYAHVLIIGGGFAGSTCALRLKSLNPGLRVTLIDPDSIYTTCPLSNEVLVGRRDLHSLRVSRRGLARHGVDYRCDRVVSIDAAARRARLGSGPEIAYDRLVLATGIRLLWGRPEGYTEAATTRMPHAWQAGAQTEILAAQLRAIADGGVVAISVPPGPMRCPPGPFERASLIADFLRAKKSRCKILIFDANNHFPRQDEFSAAWASLYPGMIEWIPVVQGGAVERVDPARMVIVSGSGEHRVDVANIIPPQAPALLAAQAGLASDHGWCPVNPLTFESTLMPNIHVIGDSCIADPMPKAASAACSQAVQCAAAIMASLSERELPSAMLKSVCYSFLNAGSAISIHGRFRVTAAGVEQLSSADTIRTSASQQAAEALDWYRTTLREAFASSQPHPS